MKDSFNLMDKHEFMQQYVLNRALIVDNLDGAKCSKEAEIAWNFILNSCKGKTK